MHATNQIKQPLQDNSSTSGSSINEPRFRADPPDPPKAATFATSQTNPIDQVRDSDRKGSNHIGLGSVEDRSQVKNLGVPGKQAKGEIFSVLGISFPEF